MTLIAELRGAAPLRASQIIVTLYGDVVEPRGGQLWMGSLIEVCALFGISETLVRTAVSRLVASGRLEGERIGRRSYYRLTHAARAEFAAAARRIFAVAPHPSGWLLAWPGPGEEEALRARGFAVVAPGILLGPDHDRAGEADRPAAALLFRAELEHGRDALTQIVAAAWDIDGLAAGYADFVASFEPVAALAADLGPEDAFVARTLLVHRFRAAMLPDPELPAAVLPADWPAPAARQLFARTYIALSPSADSQVSRVFQDANGPLDATTPASRARLRSLRPAAQ